MEEESAKYNIRTTENQFAHLKSSNVVNEMPVFGGKNYDNSYQLQKKLNNLRTDIESAKEEIKELKDRKNKEIDILKALLNVKQTHFNLEKYSKLKYSDLVVRVVCDVFRVDKFDLHSKNRKRELVYARGLIWCIWKKNLPLWTVTKMGLLFGRDHATVLHGIGSNRDLRQYDLDFRTKCEMVETLLDSYISKQENYKYQ